MFFGLESHAASGPYMAVLCGTRFHLAGSDTLWRTARCQARSLVVFRSEMRPEEKRVVGVGGGRSHRYILTQLVVGRQNERKSRMT